MANNAAHRKVTVFVLAIAIFYPLRLSYYIYAHGYDSLYPTRWLLGGLLYLLAWRLIISPYFFSPLRNLPTSPNPHFVLGDGPNFLQHPLLPFLLDLAREVPNNGLILIRSFFHVGEVLLATTPETLMEVLNAHPYDYEKPRVARRMLARTLGRGLIIVEGQEHKVQRRAVAAAFQGKHVRELVPIFWGKAVHMADTVAAMISDAAAGMNGNDISAHTGTVEITALASRCTLDIIGKAGFGRDLNTLDNSEDVLAKQYETIMDPNKGNLIIYLLINLLPPWLSRRVPWKRNIPIWDARTALRKVSRQMVAKRKAEVLEEEEENSQSVDILSVLMRSTDIPEELLVDQCLTFLAAGHETTASAISWTCYFLGLHQDIQSDLRRELEEKIPQAALRRGSEEAQMTASFIDSFPLLHGVCNETLRLYPTVPLTSRHAIRDTIIQGQKVPKGTEILISPWMMNHLESIWGDDAASFRPSRWMGSEEAAAFGGAKSRAAFLTFIHGPRSCIGQGFARLEMKCLLAALVLRFKFELAEPDVTPIPAGTVTIKPRDGMRLVMTEITRDEQ